MGGHSSLFWGSPGVAGGTLPHCRERWELLPKATRQPQSAGEWGRVALQGKQLVEKQVEKLVKGNSACSYNF